MVRPPWLAPGLVLLGGSVLVPVLPDHPTAGLALRSCALVLALPCFVLAAPPPSALSPRAGRRWRRAFLVTLWLAFTLTSGAANQWRSTVAVSEYPDPVSYFVQAKIVVHGALWLPSPQSPEFFPTPYMINDGRFYCMYPPGWPILLATGMAAGVPWMVNPLLAAPAAGGP